MDALRFLDNVSDLDIETVMIHGRDIKQMHAGPVDAEIIKKARDYFGGLIVANGGVRDKRSAEELLGKSKADGLGIGQGALGRPWVFENVKGDETRSRNKCGMTKGGECRMAVMDVFEIALEHAKLAHKNKGDRGIVEMRKHLCWYVQGMPGARKLREEFVKVETLDDVKNIIKKQKN